MKVLRSTVALSAIAAAMLSTNASAVNISTDGVGEVAIAPFYTTREGWLTTINLINTQNVPVVVKVRFHEALNSRDVLDFTVALSSFDNFVGVVKEGANGQPVFVNTDQANAAGLKTCTIPSTESGAEIPLNVLGYTGTDQAGDNNSDGGVSTVDRLREGYVEFIVEGYGKVKYAVGQANAGKLYGTGAPIDATGVGGYSSLTTADRRNYLGYAIESHDCATVRSAFVQSTIGNTAKQLGEPISALKFNFSLLNPQDGTEAGYSATTWSNFYNPGNGSGTDGLVVPEDNFYCSVDRGIERRGNSFNGRVVTVAGATVAGSAENWCPQGLSGFACDTGAVGAQNVQGNLFTGAAVLQAPDVVESCRNLVTAQVNDDFLEPTLNDAYPPIANWYDDKNNALLSARPLARNILNGGTNLVETIRGVDALSLTIQRQAIINEWSTNPDLGVSTDWVVTQPTKAFYVDEGRGAQFQVISNRVYANPTAVPPVVAADATQALKGRAEALLEDPLAPATSLETPFAPYQKRFAQVTAGDVNSAKSCNRVDFTLYDRAEQSAQPVDEEPIFSPAPATPQASDNLCYESNLINFAATDGTLRSAFGTSALNRTTVKTNTLAVPATSGWMVMFMDPAVNLVKPAIGASVVEKPGNGTANTDAAAANFNVLGLPVIGVNIKTRNFPNRPDLSFSSSSDHSYIRTLAAP